MVQIPAVQDGDHLLTLLRYIEANPLRAGMLDDSADYRWSSFPAHALGRPDPLLDPFPEWDALGDSVATRCASWRIEVVAPIAEAELEVLRVSARTGRPLAEPDWVASVSPRLRVPPR